MASSSKAHLRDPLKTGKRSRPCLYITPPQEYQDQNIVAIKGEKMVDKNLIAQEPSIILIQYITEMSVWQMKVYDE